MYDMFDKIGQVTKLKESMNISVPYCVYSQNPQIAADIDNKMIKIIEDAQNLLYRQYWAPAVWEITAAASTIVAGPFGPMVIGMIQNWNEEAWMNQQTVKLSSRASLIKSEMIRVTAKYCSREEVRKLARQMFGIPQNLPTPDAQFVLDPSGYVYEAVTSNLLEGVTATIYQKVTTEDMYGDKHENIVKWDAESYSQRNPVKTDANGLYSWDVPDGLWQVKFEKDGYETIYSDWLPVPPPQLDINVPMYQSVQPEVTGARGFESGVDFTFSKYMRPATFAEGTVTLSHDGKPVSGHLKMLNIEKEPLDGVEYVSHIKFVPDKSLNVGDEVTLTISREVKSYCGVTMEKDYTATLVIQPEINEIAVDSVVNVGYGSNSVIEVSVLPADAAKGKILRLQNGTPSILATDVTELTLDAGGKTKIPVSGTLPGTGALRLSVENSDVSTNIKVNVITAPTEVAAPKSSMPTGSTVEKGSLIVLSCTTEGATIYYTLDGSCPCDEATRLTYTEPIVINKTVTIKAMAIASNMTESEVVEFTYIVDDGDDINDVTITVNQDPNKSENYYSTFYSSTNAYHVPEGVIAYTGVMDGNVLKLIPIKDGIIPVGEGVILRRTTADNTATHQEIALAATSKTSTKSDTNILLGTDEATTLKANQYALSLGQNGVGFYLWENKPIGAHKAYLTLSGLSAGAKVFTFEFDDGETTGILKPVKDEKKDDPAYNLNGIRVSGNYKGTVIKNGKKTIKNNR